MSNVEVNLKVYSDCRLVYDSKTCVKSAVDSNVTVNVDGVPISTQTTGGGVVTVSVDHINGSPDIQAGETGPGLSRPNPSDNRKMAHTKTDWNQFKQDRRQLRLERKRRRGSYDICLKVKQMYEVLRCRNATHKHILVEKMYTILDIDDMILKMIVAHDSSRVVQCMLKYAAPDLREKISSKLIPKAAELCQSKYAHFCINRMLKYGSPSTKKSLVKALYGNVVRLCGHKIASKIMDYIYLNGNSKERRYLRQEFYGDLYKLAKDDKVKCLKDTFENSPNMKASIIGAVKANLEHIANKELLDNSLVHAVLLEYIQVTDEEKLEETVTPLAAYIPYMLSTKDGTEAAILCFYYSTSKTRRAVIKKIKEHLLKISMHEHGHTFLIALLNALDDTKAIKKSIFDPLYGDLKTLVSNNYGRRVVQWMVAPGDTSCFHPGFIETIELGLKFGKKDKATRRQEILDQVEAPISLAMAESPAFWLSNNHIGLVTANILKHLTGEHYEKAVTALAQVIADVNWRIAEVSDEGELMKKKPQDVETYISNTIEERKNKNKNKNKLKSAALALITSDEEADAEDKKKENVKDKENDKEEEGDEEEGTPAKKPKKAETLDADNETPDAVKETLTVEEETPAKEEEAVPSINGIEDAGMHHVIKKIIRSDLKRESTPFGNQLFNHLNTDVLKFWLGINRACFILVKLVENSPDLLNKCRILFKEENLSQIVEDAQSPGAKLLLEKLKE
ncbi:uncharacterized protein Dmoj_GI14891, isoform B [Drosophila mojavensis]|uniref:Uncharacterized protein, isoform B n=1 Tax=Drosophila mojavensis TaxID=7230 RepID=A0A0Q9WMU6_DROMO|nr:uncharacterized protein Dmoj_GI14891, isoform B [Drosophila mojavensis]